MLFGFRHSVLILFFAFLVALSGCSGEKKKPGVYIGEKEGFLSSLQPSAVLLSVNGAPFTRHDFDVVQSLYGKIFQYKETGVVMPASTQKARTLVKNREQREEEDFLRRTLMRQEACKLGLSVLEADIEQAGKQFLEAIKAPNKIDFKVFLEKLSDEERQKLIWMLESDLLAEKLRQKIGGKNLEISEQEIDEGAARVQKHNEVVAATNKVLSARMEMVLKQARAGEDFAVLAKTHSQVRVDQGADWGWYFQSEIENANLRKWVQGAKVGAVSDVFELEDGISIVKMLEIREHKEAGAQPSVFEYHLARITMFVFDEAPVMERAQIKKELFNWKKQELQKSLGTRLYREAVIEYPSGTNLFPKVVQKTDSVELPERK